ncbi:MAG: DUF438 domain-containing protein [candidate division Zixibacteria bacterium]
MSELVNQVRQRKELLKHMILQLHEGKAPEEVKPQLLRLLGRVPYSEVVEVEQELISEGLPSDEVLKLCDMHTAAMKGVIDASNQKVVPSGHPVDTFHQENKALQGELTLTEKLYDETKGLLDDADASELIGQIRTHFGMLSDVEKHYMRKENLLFPFLEKKGITGPPKVMWGKHDEVREYLKGAIEALQVGAVITVAEAKSLIELVLRLATDAIGEMIYKEEEILLPMSLDKLSESEWYSIYTQSPELGFCLFDPTTPWQPESVPVGEAVKESQARVRFPSGSMTPAELNAILNTIPFDLTFVDKDDTVRYFTQGRERIFARNRAIIGRKVQLCHPPSSVHIVQQILDNFHSGKQDRAPFWITINDRFIHIEYYALRDDNGEYLGTLEVSQDLTEKRALEGEHRLLTYAEK